MFILKKDHDQKYPAFQIKAKEGLAVLNTKKFLIDIQTDNCIFDNRISEFDVLAGEKAIFYAYENGLETTYLYDRNNLCKSKFESFYYIKKSDSRIVLIEKKEEEKHLYFFDVKACRILGYLDSLPNRKPFITYLDTSCYFKSLDRVNLICKKIYLDDSGGIIQGDFPKWQVNVSEFSSYFPSSEKRTYGRKEKPIQIRKIYGVANELALVELNNSKIIGLDVETGQLSKEWWKVNENVRPSYPYIGSYTASLDEESGQIVGVEGRGIFIIDPMKDDILYHAPPIMEEHRMNIAIQRTTFDAHHVYAMGKREIIDNNYESFLIAINRSTGTIDWLYILPEPNEQSYGPVVAGNKLYFILNNKLMTFVREEVS